MATGEGLDSLLLQKAVTLVDPAVQQHLHQRSHLLSIGEESRMSTDASHGECIGIVNGTTDKSPDAVDLGRRNSMERVHGTQHRNRIEERMDKSHGVVKMLLHKTVEGLAAHMSHHIAQQHESQIAIHHTLFFEQRSGDNQLEDAIVVRGFLPVTVESLQSGTMAHGLFDGDMLLVGTFQVRQIFAQTVVNLQLPNVHQLHHRQRGGTDLGDRCKVVERLTGHGVGTFVIGQMSIGPIEYLPPFVEHHNLASRHRFCRYSVVHHRVDTTVKMEVQLGHNLVAGSTAVVTGDDYLILNIR